MTVEKLIEILSEYPKETTVCVMDRYGILTNLFRVEDTDDGDVDLIAED